MIMLTIVLVKNGIFGNGGNKETKLQRVSKEKG